MKIIGITAMMAALLLSGCVTPPEPTLEEKLAGKTEAQKQEILRKECQSEAFRGHQGMRVLSRQIDDRYQHHVHNLMEICRTMTNVPQKQKGEK
jgi:starvation-inducible outer membrane lipoprotein